MLTLYIDGTGTINFIYWHAGLTAKGYLLNGHLNAQYTNKQLPQRKKKLKQGGGGTKYDQIKIKTIIRMELQWPNYSFKNLFFIIIIIIIIINKLHESLKLFNIHPDLYILQQKAVILNTCRIVYQAVSRTVNKKRLVSESCSLCQPAKLLWSKECGW